jgi:RNase adaptor protein for sRNA GlmZ degradation
MPFTELSKSDVGVFSLNRHAPTHQMYEFDLSHFRDPQGKPEMRFLFGTDPKVIDFIKADPRLEAIVHTCRLLAHDAEKRKISYISFGFRDYHGRLISAAVAQIVGLALNDEDFNVHISHSGASHADPNPHARRAR